MRHALHIFWIRQAAHIDIHRRRGFVCVWIVNEEGLQLVGKANHSV